MRNSAKFIRAFKSSNRLKWVLQSDENCGVPSNCTEIIYYRQEVAEEHNANRIANIISSVMKEEFPEIKQDNPYYDLLMYGLTKRLSTMQSIKNVLLYKRENNIKQIKDVCFKNREVQLTCLI